MTDTVLLVATDRFNQLFFIQPPRIRHDSDSIGRYRRRRQLRRSIMVTHFEEALLEDWHEDSRLLPGMMDNAHRVEEC